MAKRRIRIPFPVNGIDRAMPDWASPPLTCTDAQNVRSRGPLSKRMTGGERDGTDRVFENNAGTLATGAPGKVITGGIVAERSSEAVVNPRGNLRNFEETFGDDYPKPFRFGSPAFETGTNFLGRWVMYAKDPLEAFSRGLPATGAYPNTPYAPARSNDPRALGNELRVTSVPLSATLEYGLIRANSNTNRHKVTVKILAAPFGRRGASSDTAAGECTYIGPIVRGAQDAAGNVCGFAHSFLERVGADEVRLRVDIYQGAKRTSFQSNRTYELSGLPGPSEFTIEADASSGQSLRVKFEWADESNGTGGTINETFVVDANEINANTFRIAVGAVPGAIATGQLVTGTTSLATARVLSWINTATCKEVVLLQTAGLFQNGETIELRADVPADPVLGSATISADPVVTPNERVGMHYKLRGANAYRSIVKSEGTDVEPLAATTVYSIAGSDADPNAGLWQVKQGWDAVDLIPGATGITSFGGTNVAYSSGTNPATDAKPEWPCIDRVGSAETAGGVLESTLTGGSAATSAAMTGSRTNKTQFFIPAGHLEFETAADWADATGYTVGNVVKMGVGEPNEMSVFKCLVAHTSSASTKPGIGASFVGTWAEQLDNYDLEIDLRDTDGTVDDSIGLLCCTNGFAGTVPVSA